MKCRRKECKELRKLAAELVEGVLDRVYMGDEDDNYNGDYKCHCGGVGTHELDVEHVESCLLSLVTRLRERVQ
jgi:hypothetical protein